MVKMAAIARKSEKLADRVGPSMLMGRPDWVSDQTTNRVVQECFSVSP